MVNSDRILAPEYTRFEFRPTQKKQPKRNAPRNRHLSVFLLPFPSSGPGYFNTFLFCFFTILTPAFYNKLWKSATGARQPFFQRLSAAAAAAFLIEKKNNSNNNKIGEVVHLHGDCSDRACNNRDFGLAITWIELF